MKQLLLLISFVGFFSTMNAQLVITEIFYNAPNAGTDSLEFIELYNKGNAAVNLNGYYFKTAIKDTFPNVTLGAGKYFVAANNAAYFKSKFGVDCHQWKTGEALNNTGERIELYSNTNQLLDSVRYLAVAPWPTSPNGGGSSLVLCDVNLDNGVPSNWSACTVATTAKISGTTLFVTPFDGKCNTGDVVSATNDNVNVTVNKSFTIGVLGNDVSTKKATIASITNPTKGIAVINATKDSIKYTPNKDYCGPDELQYTITDGTLTSTAKVTINVSGCQTAGTIKDAKTTNPDGTLKNLNNVYTFSGVVNSINFRPAGLEFPIIDTNGDGIGVFNNTKSFGYTVKEGDIVTVKGKLSQFNGYAQITADTIYKTGTGTVAVVKTVTKLDETTESQIVVLKNVSLVDATKWVAAGSGFNVEVTDGTNKTSVRIDADTDLFNATVPTGKFDITGVGYQFDSSLPYSDGYQLYPRYVKDIKKVIATNDIALGEAVKLYPNPINEVLEISLSETMDKLVVTNMVGQVIYASTNLQNTQTLNTSAWQSGVYFVTFVKNERQFTTRVVKQ